MPYAPQKYAGSSALRAKKGSIEGGNEDIAVKLTIVIPALNEEEAIGSTIERCLASRSRIVAESPVDEVEIIVVSDGSTDRTAEIAAGYDDVQLIVFERNRGYGAAIKAGFEQGSGEIVGFLDADGTCDPAFFGPLCRALTEHGAEVALGSRMGPQSRMPRVRRVGNTLYALILSALSNRPLSDTASGMRVIRRDALRRLYPLPDGLHFTPAMSARVLMDDSMRIAELPMPYEERIGESKLHVLRDGVRFLRTIMQMTLVWQPGRLFVGAAVAFLLVMLLLAAHPIETWLRMGRLQEDMIYRLLFCSLMGTFGVTLLSAGALSNLIHRLLSPHDRQRTFFSVVLDRCYTARGLALQLAVAIPSLMWLVGSGVWTRITDGHVHLHWSRIVLAGLIAFACGQALLTTLIANVLRFHTVRRQADDDRETRRQVRSSTAMLNIPIPDPEPQEPSIEPAIARPDA